VGAGGASESEAHGLDSMLHADPSVGRPVQQKRRAGGEKQAAFFNSDAFRTLESGAQRARVGSVGGR
jgi:hypothetical protein